MDTHETEPSSIGDSVIHHQVSRNMSHLWHAAHAYDVDTVNDRALRQPQDTMPSATSRRSSKYGGPAINVLYPDRQLTTGPQPDGLQQQPPRGCRSWFFAPSSASELDCVLSR
jgi:hypothetical protein